MSLRETLLERLEDLNVSNLTIDKNEAVHGRPATRVAFVMTNPKGFPTGELDFEIYLAHNMGLSHEDMADLTYSYANNQMRAMIMDEEFDV